MTVPWRRVGMELPEVEVRFENLTIESSVYVGSRALPSVLNAYRNVIEVSISSFVRAFLQRQH